MSVLMFDAEAWTRLGRPQLKAMQGFIGVGGGPTVYSGPHARGPWAGRSLEIVSCCRCRCRLSPWVGRRPGRRGASRDPPTLILEV